MNTIKTATTIIALFVIALTMFLSTGCSERNYKAKDGSWVTEDEYRKESAQKYLDLIKKDYGEVASIQCVKGNENIISGVSLAPFDEYWNPRGYAYQSDCIKMFAEEKYFLAYLAEVDRPQSVVDRCLNDLKRIQRELIDACPKDNKRAFVMLQNDGVRVKNPDGFGIDRHYNFDAHYNIQIGQVVEMLVGCVGDDKPADNCTVLCRIIGEDSTEKGLIFALSASQADEYSDKYDQFRVIFQKHLEIVSKVNQDLSSEKNKEKAEIAKVLEANGIK